MLESISILGACFSGRGELTTISKKLDLHSRRDSTGDYVVSLMLHTSNNLDFL